MQHDSSFLFTLAAVLCDAVMETGNVPGKLINCQTTTTQLIPSTHPPNGRHSSLVQRVKQLARRRQTQTVGTPVLQRRCDEHIGANYSVPASVSLGAQQHLPRFSFRSQSGARARAGRLRGWAAVRHTKLPTVFPHQEQYCITEWTLTSRWKCEIEFE
jgi:hypothetical protein